MVKKPQVANLAQAYQLDQLTQPGSLGLQEGDAIRCVACGHRCLIGEGRRGICKVRYVQHGELRVPWGYVAGLQSDPVEKKPFFHVLPGSDALTFGMLGCDLHCAYCQNWFTSQALRDYDAKGNARPVTPAQLVDIARREGARLVVSSYNEPLITTEWSAAVFAEAHAAGLLCAFVSNGNATPEALDHLAPWIRAYKIDLKGFNDRHYRTLGCPLSNILDGIRMVHERGLWLEIVTLLIPGFNDDEGEIRELTRFVASISRDIPWHVTAFHSDYRMQDTPSTDVRQLLRAAEIGAEAGLRFVYAGNRPGQVGDWENTRCPGCQETLIERYGFLVRSYRVAADGTCPSCATRLPGIWHQDPSQAQTGDMEMYQLRMPRALR
jgi:pyruvate formate lyase activating enzyme